MNWFKHDADATQDAKIKKLLIRHGAVGYAVYFHCLELIAAEVSESNLTFELEHDSEIIADNLHIHGTSVMSGIQIVEEIMRYIIELGLFESSNDKIFCFKLLKRMDLSMTSNPSFRKMIAEAKERHDTVMTHHDGVMRASKPNKQDKQEEEELRARDLKAEQEEAPPRGALPNEPVILSELSHFQIAGYWFKKYNQITGITIMPDERANLMAKDLFEVLGKNSSLAYHAIDYYFDNWRDLWFACKRMPKDTSPEKRQWSFTFSSFVKNIQEILSLMQTPPTPASTVPKRWSSGISFEDHEVSDEERAENAKKLAGFIHNLGVAKQMPMAMEQG